MSYNNLNITVNTRLSLEVDDFVQLVYDANTSIYGRVVSYNSSTGALTITPYSYSGTSGTTQTLPPA